MSDATAEVKETVGPEAGEERAETPAAARAEAVQQQRPPAGPFVRRLPGANLSLEVNTERVPADEACYVLRDGEIVFRSPEYPVALAEYQRLCAEYWEQQLDSADAETRLRAARGLYAQDAAHPRALLILKADGDSRDRRRLEQASQRSAYAKRAAAQRIR
jgi:hypothetical protein